MNILEVGVAPGLGGLELYFHRCCKELATRGHHVTSVTLLGSRLEELARREGVSTIAVSGGYKILAVGNALRLARIIREKEIEIVHVHLKDNLLLVALAKFFSSRKFKLVFTRQMPMAQSKKDPYHSWIYRKIDLYITITEKLRSDAMRYVPLPPSRIRRLYYGVAAPPPLTERDTAFLSISAPGDFNIGVFSRLEHQKGQHMVIDALHILRKQNVPAKLYIAGDVMNADYKSSLEQQIGSHHLHDHVVFKGFLSKPVHAMMCLDALVLPSRNEAFGLVLIEAMRCGVPVLGVNAGGVPEIIDHGETGLLFDWENPGQLADQLGKLFRDQSFRMKLGAKGKQKADNEFDQKVHFDRLEALFREVLTG